MGARSKVCTSGFSCQSWWGDRSPRFVAKDIGRSVTDRPDRSTNLFSASIQNITNRAPALPPLPQLLLPRSPGTSTPRVEASVVGCVGLNKKPAPSPLVVSILCEAPAAAKQVQSIQARRNCWSFCRYSCNTHSHGQLNPPRAVER
jgi:hypothetical protein